MGASPLARAVEQDDGPPDHRAPDESHPHYEEPLHTDNGGLMLFVQYQGPTTGGRPIYEGRVNMTARKRIEEENVEV